MLKSSTGYFKNHCSVFLNKLFKPIPKEEHKVSLNTWYKNTIKNVMSNKNSRYMKNLKIYKPYTKIK